MLKTKYKLAMIVIEAIELRLRKNSLKMNIFFVKNQKIKEVNKLHNEQNSFNIVEIDTLINVN